MDRILFTVQIYLVFILLSHSSSALSYNAGSMDEECTKVSGYRPVGEIYKLSAKELTRTLRDHKYLKPVVLRMNGRLMLHILNLVDCCEFNVDVCPGPCIFTTRSWC